MKIKAVCVSHKGLRRDNNEDNFYFNGRYMQKVNNGTGVVLSESVHKGENGLFCVFDGMGGHSAGELASYTAAVETEAFLKANGGIPLPLCKGLDEMVLDCSETVFRVGEESGNRNMGTTAVMLYFTGGAVYACNVGDSPAFLLDDNGLEKLTQDHVEILPANSTHKPRLTQCLGFDPMELRVEPFIAKREVKSGDTYLICSDGVTDMVSEEEIAAILNSSVSLKRVAEKLLQSALSHGGIDNITITLCKVI